jgi:hypothetical protein
MANVITPRIVNLVATLTASPVPSQLQQSGAFVSVGGTTLTVDTYKFFGSLPDLKAVLETSGGGNQAELLTMGATFFAQGNAVGVYILELGTQASNAAAIEALDTWIQGNPGIFYAYLAPADWDGQSEVVGSVSVTLPGSGYTTAPTVTFSGGGGTGAAATAAIANGIVTGVTITNAGADYTSAPTVVLSAPSSGATATATANLASELVIVASQYDNPAGKTYFFVTTSEANVASYQPHKSVCAFVPAALATNQEFGAAEYFYQTLVNKPGLVTKLAPQSYRYAFGVTAWPSTGSQTDVTTILSAYGNIFYPTSEAGISEVGQWKGTFSDGTQMSWWYGIDWYQIQVARDLAAAIINGSNSLPPLLYDQDGINTLAAIAQRDLNTAISFGCALSGTVTAIPFGEYVLANPDDYQAGIYNGLSATVVGQNGFLSITFALDAVQFA